MDAYSTLQICSCYYGFGPQWGIWGFRYINGEYASAPSNLLKGGGSAPFLRRWSHREVIVQNKQDNSNFLWTESFAPPSPPDITWTRWCLPRWLVRAEHFTRCAPFFCEQVSGGRTYGQSLQRGRAARGGWGTSAGRRQVSNRGRGRDPRKQQYSNDRHKMGFWAFGNVLSWQLSRAWDKKTGGTSCHVVLSLWTTNMV